VWAWFALLGFKSRRVKFIVSFTTLCKVMMVISQIWPITFGTFRILNMANSYSVPLFPTIFALRSTWVHVSIPHHNDDTSNIESPIDIFFALLLFHVSQISIQTIAISNLDKTLMTLSLDARTILLKM